MMLTAHHAKYHARDLTRQAPPRAADQLSMSLFDASVDLNPKELEQRQRMQRREISKVEDEIEEQRDSLIAALVRGIAGNRQNRIEQSTQT